MKGMIISLISAVLLLSLFSSMAIAHEGGVLAQDDNVEAKFKEAKDKVTAAKAAHEAAKAEFEKAREAYKANKTEERKQEAFEKARAFLTRSLERMTEHLQLVREKTETHKALTDAERTEILADIDEDIAFFESKKTEVSNATTHDQIVNLEKEIRARWTGETRKGIMRSSGKVLEARERKLVEEIENVSSRIEQKINTLKANGADTAKLEELLLEYNVKIIVAKEKYAAARAVFQGNHSEERNKEAHNLLREAHQALKEAKDVLKQIIEEVKNLRTDIKDERKSAINETREKILEEKARLAALRNVTKNASATTTNVESDESKNTTTETSS